MKLPYNDIAQILSTFFDVPVAGILKLHQKNYMGRLHSFVYIRKPWGDQFKSSPDVSTANAFDECLIANSANEREGYVLLDGFVKPLRAILCDDDMMIKKGIIISSQWIAMLKAALNATNN